MTEPTLAPGTCDETDIVLRPATPSDAASIADLPASRFDRGWSVAEFQALLADPVVFAVLAETGKPADGPAGFIAARSAAGEAEILTLAVSARHERAGIGLALVEYACRTATSRSAGSVFLEVAAANRPALALYRRCGFLEAARRPQYYGNGEGADAIVMRRDLSQLVDARP